MSKPVIPKLKSTTLTALTGLLTCARPDRMK